MMKLFLPATARSVSILISISTCFIHKFSMQLHHPNLYVCLCLWHHYHFHHNHYHHYHLSVPTLSLSLTPSPSSSLLFSLCLCLRHHHHSHLLQPSLTPIPSPQVLPVTRLSQTLRWWYLCLYRTWPPLYLHLHALVSSTTATKVNITTILVQSFGFYSPIQQ